MEYTVQSQSLTQVANAIREKTRDPELLEFPDEFVVAIRSIQPQQTDIIGGTVGWNQLQGNTASRTNNGITYTYADGELKVSGTATNTSYWVSQTIAVPVPVYKGHKYLILLHSPSYVGSSSTYWAYIASNAFSPRYLSGTDYLMTTPSEDSTAYIQFQVQSGIEIDLTIIPTFHDLTTLLGSTIADTIYTIEQSTPGAGVAIIKQLLTKDYYPYSLPDLSSIMYANDWENFGDSYILNGFLRLSSNSLYRWGDILSNGNVTRKTARIAMTDLTWTLGTMAAYEATLPNWVGSNGIEPILETVISDAYPTALFDVWFGLTPTDLSAAPDKYLYQIYESQSSDTKHYKIYIKDTSIATVSDLMTALAGKEIVYAISDENYSVAGKRYRGRADIEIPDAKTLTFGDDPEYAYFYRSPGVEQAVTQIIVTATKVSYINENGNEIEVATLDSGLQWDGDDYGQLIWFGDNAPDMSPEEYEWFISLYEEII